MIGEVYLWQLIFYLRCKKVDRFQSKYFKVLPKKSEILSKLSNLEIDKVNDIFLFKYSSCSAVFCVEIIDKNNEKKKIVIRGEQQNGNTQDSFSVYSLEKEIQIFKKMQKLGLNVPEILFNSEIHSVPGYDKDGKYVRDFNFYLMSYIDGIAIDKKMNSVNYDEKIYWLDKISKTMAKVHSVKGYEYGFIDEYNKASFKTNSLEGFLNALHNTSVKLLLKNIGDEFANEVDIFMKNKNKSLSHELKNFGYSPQISLVLYDGSAGNMLIKDDNIQFIDLASAGYFEPLTDFCAHFFCMKDILMLNYNGKMLWDYFVESYKVHGGKLPPEPYLTKLFHIINVYFLCDAVIVYKTHSGLDKRKKTKKLIDSTRRVMKLVSPSICDIARAL